MLRSLLLLPVFALVLAGPASASARRELFPDEVNAARGERVFAHLDELPLWTPGAFAPGSRQIRMIIGGFTLTSWSIRLVQSRDGFWTGFYAVHGQDGETERVRFAVRSSDISELEQLIARARLWNIYPQFWVESEPDICLDGVTVIFERRDDAGYRYSEGNAQCTLGTAQIQAAAKMMRLAGHPELEKLLY